MTTDRDPKITSFKPLTGWRKFGLKILHHHIITLLIMYAIVCFLGTSKIEWARNKHGENILILGTVLVLIAVIWLLKKHFMRATRILNLEKFGVLCSLHKRDCANPTDRRTYYRTTILTPLRMPNARHEIVEDSTALVSMILPLRRGELVEVYIRQDGEMMNMVFFPRMHLETVEAFWGETDLKTCVRLVDNSGSSLMMNITTALERIYKNRYRIASIGSIDVLLRTTEDQLTDAEQAIGDYQTSLARSAADRSTLISAITDAASELSNFERLFRSWVPVCEIGMTLVRTLNACPSQKEAERTRTAVAKAEFEKDRDKDRSKRPRS